MSWNGVFGILAFANVIFIWPIWLITLNYPTPGVPFEVVAISTTLMVITGLIAWKTE